MNLYTYATKITNTNKFINLNCKKLIIIKEIKNANYDV